MKCFEDAKGNKRTLSLTIGKARKAKAELGLDFLDGDAAKICNDILLSPLKQLDLIWHLLDGKDAIESPEGVEPMEHFEGFLDGDAFGRAKPALIAEVTNFIQSLRPEQVEVFKGATDLILKQVTESAKRAASLIQSKEVQEGFITANANAEASAKKEISKQFSKFAEAPE